MLSTIYFEVCMYVQKKICIYSFLKTNQNKYRERMERTFYIHTGIYYKRCQNPSIKIPLSIVHYNDYCSSHIQDNYVIRTKNATFLILENLALSIEKSVIFRSNVHRFVIIRMHHQICLKVK